MYVTHRKVFTKDYVTLQLKARLSWCWYICVPRYSTARVHFGLFGYVCAYYENDFYL